MTALYMVNRDELGKRFCNFCKSPMVLLGLDATIFKYLQNFNCLSSITRKCFSDEDCKL